MAVQKQDDQHEHTFSSYVRIRDVVLKTCLNDREEWREKVTDIRATMMMIINNLHLVSLCTGALYLT